MDTHNLERFITAQKADYAHALSEIKEGRKRRHWMWYIFPQIQGLGFTSTSKFYAILDLAEAEAYLKHRVLGPRLIQICEALIQLKQDDPQRIFGSIDQLKLKSSMTLFAAVQGADPIFGRVLDKYFNGERDKQTLKILELVGDIT